MLRDLIPAARRVWRLRVELLTIGLTAAGALLAAGVLVSAPAAVALLALFTALLVHRRTRAWIGWRVHVLHLRRWWASTAPLSGLATPDGRTPRIRARLDSRRPARR